MLEKGRKAGIACDANIFGYDDIFDTKTITGNAGEIKMSQVRTRKRGNIYSYIFETGKATDAKKKVVEKGGFGTQKDEYNAGVTSTARKYRDNKRKNNVE